MSLITDAMTQALSIISTAKGEALLWSATIGGTYAALTGFVLDRDEPVAPQYDDSTQGEAYIHTGRLSGPLSPVLALGYFIKDGENNYWVIERVDNDQQQLCSVKRTFVAHMGPDRGGAS